MTVVNGRLVARSATRTTVRPGGLGSSSPVGRGSPSVTDWVVGKSPEGLRRLGGGDVILGRLLLTARSQLGRRCLTSGFVLPVMTAQGAALPAAGPGRSMRPLATNASYERSAPGCSGVSGQGPAMRCIWCFGA
jgi:hypothetical protein